MNTVKSNGASNTLFQHERPNQPKRSKFDLSRITNISLDTGMIVPFDCFPVLPGDIASISQEAVLDTLPLVQSSLTNYKVVFHWYYMKSRDLWKGFKTFITKGRTGNIELQIPRVDLNYPIDKNTGHNKVVFTSADDEDYFLGGYYYPVSQHSLSSFLGVPPYISGDYALRRGDDYSSGYLSKSYLPYTFHATTEGTTNLNAIDTYNNLTKSGFGNYSKPSALPFVMYQSIVKNNYVNQNLLQNNKALFPEEGDDDWLLPYTIEGGIANYISGRSQIDSSGKINFDGIFSNDETDVDIRLLRYAMFDDDYFTTGLPWLQRGDVQDLSFEFDNVTASLTSNLVNDNIVADWEFSDGTSNTGAPLFFRNDGTSQDIDGANRFKVNLYSPQNSNQLTNLSKLRLESKYVNTTLNSLTAATTGFTANMLRELLAMSVWQERNARVDGSYNRMIFQHWSQNPKSEEHVPIYIGGTAQYMNFSTIVQNSQTTSNSPLGSTAGYGNSSGSSDICTYKCDDYGYIMGIMIIKPNTTYQQGVERYLSCENTFTDFIQPEFEGLSPQPILNKELFVSGDSNDEDLFCYQERNTSYKVRQNVNRGLFQCRPDKDILFGAFTQARWFENRPKFSYQFCVMSPENIRRDWLAYPVYPAFRAQILSKVFITRSLSYSSVPNTFGF